jgi:hypothetical protein
VEGVGGVLESCFELLLDGIRHSSSIVRSRLGLGLQDFERNALRAEVRGVLDLRYERQRAVDDDLDEVCRHELALCAIDRSQRVLNVGAEACSVLAEWDWPYGLLRPQCRHGMSGTVGCCGWLVNWRQERPFEHKNTTGFRKSSSQCVWCFSGMPLRTGGSFAICEFVAETV